MEYYLYFNSFFSIVIGLILFYRLSKRKINLSSKVVLITIGKSFLCGILAVITLEFIAWIYILIVMK